MKQSESRMTRITRILRILGVPLFVVVRFVLGLSESRIIARYTDFAGYFSESRIFSDDTDDADFKTSCC